MSLANAFHVRNVPVTGGLGFIGSNLAIFLGLARRGETISLCGGGRQVRDFNCIPRPCGESAPP